MKVRPVILAGGIGERLKPLSKPHRPKQFIKFDNNLSFFQKTVQRLQECCNQTPLIITNINFEKIVLRQLKEVNIEADIIFEITAKGTATSIITASLYCNNDEILLISPADHHVANLENYYNAINVAAANLNDNIATIGIKPVRPEQNYGYVKLGAALSTDAYELEAFVEKPSQMLASELIKDQGYLWNSGIFIAKGASINHLALQYCPQIYHDSFKALGLARQDAGRVYLADDFKMQAGLSFDKAIMEHVQDSIVIAGKFEWSDIGSWHCLTNYLASCQQYNEEVYKTWGKYFVLCEGSGYKIKRLIINPGQNISLQTHNHREEFWVVKKGVGQFFYEGQMDRLNVGSEIYIDRGHKHWVKNIGDENLEIIEIQLGNCLEEDIVRYSFDENYEKLEIVRVNP